MRLSILFGCAFFFLSTCIHATIIVVSTNDTYMDRAALFGPAIDHDAPLAGSIINMATLAADRYGCMPIVGLPPSLTWIALVERGHCSFTTKVRAMQQSNAKAVIIGDPHLNHWITMYALEDTSDIKVPSVYVAQYQFRALQLHSMDQPILIQLVNDNETTWSWMDMMMLILLSPCVFLLLLYFGWKCRTYHCHLNNVAPCHVVLQLPTRYVHPTKELDKDNQDTCAICLETYFENDYLRILPCRHEFHAHCIDPWLTTHKKVCPICKFNVCQALSSHSTEHTPLLPV